MILAKVNPWFIILCRCGEGITLEQKCSRQSFTSASGDVGSSRECCDMKSFRPPPGSTESTKSYMCNS